MFSFLAGLIDAFAPFGQIKIIWPGGKDNRNASYSSKGNFSLGLLIIESFLNLIYF